MKKILLCLLLASANSFAAVVLAEVSNNLGGKIILTESWCPNKRSRIAYATNPNNNQTYTGCWSFDELFFHTLIAGGTDVG